MLENLVAGTAMVVATVIIHGAGLLAMSAALRRVINRYRPHQTLAGTVVTMVLTVLGLFVLRRRRPDLVRPYRVWGYPVVPLLFVAVALFFLVYTPVAEPRYTGFGLLLTVAGVPAYMYWRRHR